MFRFQVSDLGGVDFLLDLSISSLFDNLLEVIGGVAFTITVLVEVITIIIGDIKIGALSEVILILIIEWLEVLELLLQDVSEYEIIGLLL